MMVGASRDGGGGRMWRSDTVDLTYRRCSDEQQLLFLLSDKAPALTRSMGFSKTEHDLGRAYGRRRPRPRAAGRR